MPMGPDEPGDILEDEIVGVDRNWVPPPEEARRDLDGPPGS
ncbi:MAG: hypothetical protein WA547_01465 [Thermoplasmata archaeon]